MEKELNKGEFMDTKTKIFTVIIQKVGTINE